MIWLWIVLSVGLTALLLRNKNIEPHNFLWALLPIDKYGITIAGFSFKPVYIFSILIVFYAIITKRFRLKISNSILFSTSALAIIVLLSCLFRGNSDLTADMYVYVMFFFTILLAALSVSLVEGRDDLRQIKDVIIATAVGYGIILLTLYSLDTIGFTLPAVTGTEALDNSIIRIFRNVHTGSLVESKRLRGFYIDANASNIYFLVGFAVLLGDWIKKGNTVRNIIFSLIITANIVLTNSRAALIVWMFIIVISIFRFFFSKAQSYKKVIFIGSILAVVFFVSIFFIYSSSLFGYIYDTLISGYTNRSALNDEYGRFTIWKEALSNLNINNWYCGVGMGNLSSLTDTNRDAHNTIIEVFCSSGIIVGISYTLYFLFPLGFAIIRRIKDNKNAFFITSIAVAYLSSVIMLFTISNVTSTYLIYLAFLLFVIPRCLEEEDAANLEYELWRNRS